jgi:hypothetical protein
MADQINSNGGGEVDFKHHARDYSLLIKLLKYGAIISLVVAFLVLIIISS